MITGFNTDVEHNGVVYHVQTEDKGLDSPLILSLVYSGGAILASKRSPYEDLIAEGFDEAALAQRLKRQHRLICAAINAGRIDELMRMGERAEEAEPTTTAAIDEPVSTPIPIDEPVSTPIPVEEPTSTPVPVEEPPLPSEPQPEQQKPGSAAPVVDISSSKPARSESAYTVHDSRRYSPLGEKASPESGIVVSLIDEPAFHAGESVTIKVLVQNQTAANVAPIVHAAVSIKILGTAFRPQIHSVTTERDGVAIMSVQLPEFNSGRAAVIIRVDAPGGSSETRRVIHPAR
ncbi:MAG: hypothetical protein ABJB61_09415 [bacterium]